MSRVVLIDNYDSFVYNLARYCINAGAEVMVGRNDQITLTEIIVFAPTRIILSPGPCTPDDAGITLEVIDYFHDKLPLLGVCLGHQALGQYFGGKVVRAEVPMHGKSSLVWHDEVGIFAGIISPFHVGRYHSLIVDKLSQDSDLIISSTSHEGEIMGIRHKRYAISGVQFHPEAILTEHGMQLINNFLKIYN